jgi:regulator of replication initiation timing
LKRRLDEQVRQLQGESQNKIKQLEANLARLTAENEDLKRRLGDTSEVTRKAADY